MYFNEEYRRHLLARLSYHNAGMEGNQSTMDDVYEILDDQILPHTHMGMRQFYEIDNHRLAYRYTINRYQEQQKLSKQMVKDFHALLLDRLDPMNGQFKSTRMVIEGTDYLPVSVSETEPAINEWVKKTNQAVLTTQDPAEFMEILAQVHLKFEEIHPFLDGNGRVGRLILIYLSIKYLRVPTYFYESDNEQYLEALAQQDISTLKDLLLKTYEDEYQIQQRMKTI